jgi:hypothetical protein
VPAAPGQAVEARGDIGFDVDGGWVCLIQVEK